MAIVKKDDVNLPEVENRTVEDAIQQWKAYQQITKEILDETDYLTINGREFKKKSAWRKYKRAFNISTEILEKNIEKNVKGAVMEATFIVRAILPNGTYSDGFGECHRSERGFQKPNHDIPATAQTRATNRAISDLIGAGEVTAEEMQEENRKTAKKNKAIAVNAKDVEQVK